MTREAGKTLPGGATREKRVDPFDSGFRPPDASGIGVPLKRVHEIDPIVIPVPGDLPDWLDPISEPEPVKPEREPERVPA